MRLVWILLQEGVSDPDLQYSKVPVQKLSLLDDAALSLEKSDYYKLPRRYCEALVLDRRRLRNGNEEKDAGRRHDEDSG